MLYTFKSSATGHITMLSDLTEQILSVLGKTPALRGVITAEELPQAIDKLQAAMQSSQLQHQPKEANNDEDHEQEEYIPFRTRAWPFLQMLQLSQKANKDVTWGI